MGEMGGKIVKKIKNSKSGIGDAFRLIGRAGERGDGLDFENRKGARGGIDRAPRRAYDRFLPKFVRRPCRPPWGAKVEENRNFEAARFASKSVYEDAPGRVRCAGGPATTLHRALLG